MSHHRSVRNSRRPADLVHNARMSHHRSVHSPRRPGDLVLAGRRYLHMLRNCQSGAIYVAPYNRLNDFQSAYNFVTDGELVTTVCLYGRHGSHTLGLPLPDYSCSIPGTAFRRLRAWSYQRDESSNKSGGQPRREPYDEGAAFWNAISTDGTILNAQYNFARPKEMMHWSEIVTYCVALRSMYNDPEAFPQQPRIPLTDAHTALGQIGKIRRIIRSNICNEEWTRAQEEISRRWLNACNNDPMITPRIEKLGQDAWLELTPGTDEFEMMVGTANGVGVVYLLAHNRDRFPPGIRIRGIRINPARNAMEFVLDAPEPEMQPAVPEEQTMDIAMDGFGFNTTPL